MTLQAQGVSSDLLGRINDLRLSRGLAPYALNSALNVAASNHARWMVDTGRVSHVQENGSRPVDRARAAGYNSSWVSENIYMGGRASVQSAWNFWVNSAVHYAGLTSPNYQHIGIGMAEGNAGRAYVLVFGVPGNAVSAAPRTGSTSAGGGAPAAPPSFVVGNDEFGNIMHQIQPGDTLGDIALTYGYTWDDIPAMLALNEMTESDMRELEIGGVFLVPPQGGTWTPAPRPTLEDTPQANAQLSDTTAEVTPQQPEPATQAPPTLTPTQNSAAPGLPSPEATAEAAASGLVAPVQFNAPTQTPPPPPTLTPTPQTLQVNPLPQPTAIAALPTIVVEPDLPQAATVSVATANVPPWWLIGAMVLQVSVLGAAGAEFLRRMLKARR